MPIDSELANYLVQGRPQKALNRAETLIAQGPDRAGRDAAEYWRNLALLFVNPDEWSEKFNHPENIGERWRHLSPRTRDKLLYVLFSELNRKVTALREGVNESRELRAEITVQSEKIKMLEKLIQELESVK